MEDDSMISGLNVESERLLGADNLPPDYAKLTIEVDVRVRQAMIDTALSEKPAIVPTKSMSDILREQGDHHAAAKIDAGMNGP